MKHGFTIVELVVVIATITILAAVGIIGYGPWQKSIRTDQVKSELAQAAAALKNHINFNNAYPANLGTVYTPGDGVVFDGGRISESSFCLRAYSSADSSIAYSVSSDRTEPRSAGCQIPPRPVAMANTASASSFVVMVTTPDDGKIDGIDVVAFKFAWRSSNTGPWIQLAAPTPTTESGLHYYVWLWNAGPDALAFVNSAASHYSNPSLTGEFRIIAVGADGDSEPAIIKLADFYWLM